MKIQDMKQVAQQYISKSAFDGDVIRGRLGEINFHAPDVVDVYLVGENKPLSQRQVSMRMKIVEENLACVYFKTIVDGEAWFRIRIKDMTKKEWEVVRHVVGARRKMRLTPEQIAAKTAQLKRATENRKSK